MFDADNFSDINNSLGHKIGDDILCEFTERLRMIFQRKTDIISRVGGDEFIVLAEISNDDQDLVAPITSQAERTLQLLSKDYVVGDDKSVMLSFSIGIVICKTNTAATVDNIMTKADEAMYDIKRQHKNGYKIVEI